ncbi:MAG TPA: carbonic anhydrase family protein [Longimicrobium sp.]|jgi:carbonic anhydrase|uniref:carbonic anhydrase family protein n=1 Tax=Longimicrobium sp. TaxID=2029185 RepID=UPI002EDB1D72
MQFRTLAALGCAALAAAAPAAAQNSFGHAQSPVDIAAPVARTGLPPLGAHYPAVAGVAVNNGHTVQVQVADGDTLNVDGGRFALLQFHFHWPSEHLLRGDSFPAEVHMVHRDAQGHLAVLGTFIRLAENDNPEWASFFAALPAEGDSVRMNTVDVARLFAITDLPAERVYRYQGSLTTPPYTEGVHWLVRDRTVEMSRGQLERLRAVMHHRYSREVQALEGREITVSGS